MLYESARKALNAQHDITQKEMAEACGVSESTISRYLSGRVTPPADIAEKMAALLQGDPSESAAPEDPPPPRAEDPSRIHTDEELLKIYMWIIDRQQKEKRHLFACLELLVVVLFVLIFIDIFNGNVGWLRH